MGYKLKGALLAAVATVALLGPIGGGVTPAEARGGSWYNSWNWWSYNNWWQNRNRWWQPAKQEEPEAEDPAEEEPAEAEEPEPVDPEEPALRRLQPIDVQPHGEVESVQGTLHIAVLLTLFGGNAA